ncbi:MAG: ABC transporter permease [Acidobacteriaceae bacterium]
MCVFLQDLRFAIRQLVRNPGFALISILSLALGIGAAVSVFSVIYAVLLHPWPYKNAADIVQAYITDPSGREDVAALQPAQILQLRQASIFADVVALNESYLNDTGGEFPDDVDVVAMTGNAFRFFGVPALLGRTFLPSDAPANRTPESVVVLTYQYWQRRFQGSRSVIGQTLSLDHKPYRILGVMPQSFTWMDPDVYIPLDTSSGSGSYPIVMRLRPGITRAAASARVRALFEQFARDRPQEWPKQYTLDVRRIGEVYSRPLGTILYALFGATGLLLGIACGNVSILLLARGTGRQHEFAVRAALGAGRPRIFRQLLTESLLLSIAGCAVGTVLAWRGVALIARWMPFQLFTRGITIPVHLPVLFFSTTLALLTGVCFGLFPALQMSRPQIAQTLRATARRQTKTERGRRVDALLIGGQIALALLLLTAGGAAVRSFEQLVHTHLGFDPRNITDYPIPIHIHAYSEWAGRAAYIEQLREKVAELPGVAAASLALIAPPSSVWDFPMQISGRTFTETQYANVDFVDPEYFTMLRIPLLQGRLWTAGEAMHGARLVLVNRTFARRYFPGGDVLDHFIRVPWLRSRLPRYVAAEGSDSWLQIIGVVGDVRNGGLDQPVKPAVYTPFSLFIADWIQVLVRSSAPVSVMEPAIRRQIASLNSSQQVSSPVESLQTHIEREPEWDRGRMVSILAGTFSGLALLLAAVGLYSVVSFSVAQRIGEFGIRMALGAQRRHILAAVFASVGLSVGIGMIVGLAISFAFSGLIAHWMAISPPGLPIVALTCSLLLVVAALACLEPAWQAIAIEPAVALRHD